MYGRKELLRGLIKDFINLSLGKFQQIRPLNILTGKVDPVSEKQHPFTI